MSLRYGVWQMPEMQIEMVADPVLVRLGSEDRIQVQVFYYDDCDVDPSVSPAFRLFGEGEITGWGYRNTPGNRIFAVLKGAVDGGLEIPHSKEALPSEDRISGKHIPNGDKVVKEFEEVRKKLAGVKYIVIGGVTVGGNACG